MSSCSRHASKEAVGACINCGKLVCAACHKEIDGKSYCPACVEKLFAPAEKKPEKTRIPTPVVAEPTPTSVEKDKIEAAPVVQLVKVVEPVVLPEKPVSEPEKIRTVQQCVTQSVSNLWWLLPVFLAWVGGLAAWLVVKDKAPKKARYMLLGGLGITVLQGVLAVILVFALCVPMATKPGQNLPVSSSTQTPSVSQNSPITSSQNTEPSTESKLPSSTQTSEPVTLTPLITKTLRISSENQTVSYGDEVSIQIPGGVLKNGQDLTISTINNTPKPASEHRIVLALYDISFSEQHEFDQQLTISIAFDPNKIPQNLLPENAILVENRNSNNQSWMNTPYTIDRQTNKVIINTFHNGQWRISCLEDGHERLITDHFDITYWPPDYSKITCPGCDDELWEKCNKALKEEIKGIKMAPDLKVKCQQESQKRRAFGITPQQEDQNKLANYEGVIPERDRSIYDTWLVVNDVLGLKGKAPHYVVDVGYFMEQSWDRYNKVFKKEPGKVTVYIDKAYDGFSSQNSWLGHIGIGYDKTDGTLPQFIGHEVFHSIQCIDYAPFVRQPGMLGEYVIPNKNWWFESTAEYAGYRIAVDGLDRPCRQNMNAEYFQEPFFSSGDPNENHPYQNAYFFDYLQSQKGVDIPAMYNAVASKRLEPAAIAANLEEYLVSVIPAPQDRILTFPQLYHDFAEYIMLNPGTSEIERPEAEHMEMDTKDMEYNIDLAAGLTAKYIAIEATVNPELRQRSLQVQLQGELQDFLRVDTYKIVNYAAKSDSGKSIFRSIEALPSWDNYLQHTQRNQSSAHDWKGSSNDITLGEGDVLFILVTNHDFNNSHQVNLKVVDLSEKTLSIIMPKTPDGKAIICTSYDFIRESPGFPSSTKFTWRIDGDEVDGQRLLKHAFGKSGDHTIELEATLDPAVYQSGTNSQQAYRTSRTFTVAKPKLTIIPLWPAGEPAPPGYIRFTVKPENMPENADYTWYIDGSKIEGDKDGASFEFTMPKDSYTVEVKANCDKSGKSEEVKSSIQFKIVELQIGIRAKPGVGTVGELTAFRVGGSTMPSDTIYTWNFGNGKGEFESSKSDGAIDYSYDKLNTYTVKVTAKGKRSGLTIAWDEIPYKVDGVPSVTLRMPGMPINPEIVNTFYADPKYIPEDALYEWYVDEESVLTAKGSEGREAIAPKGFLSVGDHHILVIVKWKDEDTRDKWVQASANFKVATSNVSPPVINYFNTSATSINEGYCAKLTWDVSGADTVVLNPGVVSLPTSGMHPGCLTSDTTFVLTATNKAGSITRSVNVKFIPNTPTPAPVPTPTPTPSPTPTPAPTPSADKEEVTFAVYRWLTTTFPDKTVTKTRQYCQSFTVTIYRVEGLQETFIPASGNSIGRNGSYSITLPVGHYKYKVNGSYTNPDGNSSGAAGFDVVKGGNNFVEVVDYATYNPK